MKADTPTATHSLAQARSLDVSDAMVFSPSSIWNGCESWHGDDSAGQFYLFRIAAVYGPQPAVHMSNQASRASVSERDRSLCATQYCRLDRQPHPPLARDVSSRHAATWFLDRRGQFCSDRDDRNLRQAASGLQRKQQDEISARPIGSPGRVTP
jgi:hypothetical protein